MVSKVLKKMEVLRGFIQIPAESRSELIGDTPLPCSTVLNGNPARIDKYGRLWSSYLKDRFSIGTRIELSKTENGHHVAPSEKQQEEAMPVHTGLESETNIYCKVLEGDWLKYLNEGSINSIHLTFLDPPV